MNRRGALLTGAVAGAAALAGAGAAWWQAGAQAVADGEVGGLWTLQLERPDGGFLSLSDRRGHPLLINFWATWCPPCLRELPEIERWYVDHRRRGWQAIGIAVDQIKPVQDYLSRQPLTLPVALAGLDGTDLVHQLGNRVGAMPFTVLIDRAGRVAWRKLGETTLDELNLEAKRIG